MNIIENVAGLWTIVEVDGLEYVIFSAGKGEENITVTARYTRTAGTSHGSRLSYEDYLEPVIVDDNEVLLVNKSGEISAWTVPDILDEINRDRDDDIYWVPFTYDDWQEGLEFTEYSLA